MKRVFIIHGWGGNPETDWLPWLKTELENKNFKVEIPSMPDSSHPKIDSWVSYLSKLVKTPNENTYFIGHSIGCQTILRYLEKLPENIHVGGVILVAPWFNLKEETWDEVYTKEIANPWINTPIDFEKIKEHTNKFVAIFSDNDPYVSFKENSEVIKSQLNAKIIIEKQKGHISGEDNVTELPVVLKELLRMSN